MKATAMTKYSFLIPFYNRTKEFRLALNSFAHWYPDRDDYELLIGVDVKNSESEQLDNLIIQYPDINIKLFQAGSKDCIIPGPIYNFLSKQASGDIFILTNPEIVHLSNIIKSIELNLPNEKDPDNTFYLVFNCAAGFVEDYNQIYPIEYKHHLWYQHRRNNRMLHFCSAITAKNYFKIEGFDEIYYQGCGYDDNDFIQKIFQHNIPCKAIQTDTVLHVEHDRSYNTDMKKVDHNRNIFIKKWCDPNHLTIKQLRDRVKHNSLIYSNGQ
jgi:hypothetical protein